jgi:hypothetical protein
VYVPSSWVNNNTRNGASPDNTYCGILNYQSEALRLNRVNDLKNYVNSGGSLVVLTQQGLSYPYGFFPLPIQFSALEYSDASVTDQMAAISPTTTR